MYRIATDINGTVETVKTFDDYFSASDFLNANFYCLNGVVARHYWIEKV